MSHTWVVKVRSCDLMGQNLQIQMFVKKLKADGKSHDLLKFGKWTESMAFIQTYVADRGEPYVCWAALSGDGGQQLGKLLIELDVYDASNQDPHVWSLAAMSSSGVIPKDKLVDVPTAKGRMMKKKGAEKQETQVYFVHCFLDRLANYTSSGLEVHPRVRITIGESSVYGPVGLADSARRVLWDSPLQVEAAVGASRMTVELYSDNSYFFDIFGEDELLGSQQVACEVNKNMWVHFNGGPPMATYSKYADRMARGFTKPSAYTGTICLHICNKAGDPKKPWPPLEAVNEGKEIKAKLPKGCQPIRNYPALKLRVRMYSGVYFEESLRGAEVNVLVVLPSAALCDFSGTKFNQDLLSFPGYINNKGELIF